MTMRLTLFTATLVQDSALSVSGVDRESNTDRPFTIVDGVPLLAGRGIKGALVAMARRFFEPLPRSVSEDPSRRTALRRSAWEIANARPKDPVSPSLRAGVGIRHKTGARAGGVLYDREIVPAGTRWSLVFRVDWSIAGSEAVEAEGILGYILSHHWTAGRCWLGGDVTRGLGWCHIEDLLVYRLAQDAYERWVTSGRRELPAPLGTVPEVEPTRSWCFRTLDVDISAGEYRPDPDDPVWGLDMLAIGPHDTERGLQTTGDGIWARPSWCPPSTPTPDALSTDRALLIEGKRPLLPGSSVRGPIRHAFSRACNAAGNPVQDPHEVQGDVDGKDPGGEVFGTVARSSRVLVRDALPQGEWYAARLHMHAEDEFSAGSYGTAKRDTVRLLRGTLPVRIVVEGPEDATVEALVAKIDWMIALGELGHLPIGGHKTRGAGWCRWEPKGWVAENVIARRSWSPPREAAEKSTSSQSESESGTVERTRATTHQVSDPKPTYVCVEHGSLDMNVPPALKDLAGVARNKFDPKGHKLTCWWCDPAIDLTLEIPPATFGRQWPNDSNVKVDEVAFFSERAVWRAAFTATGFRWVFIEEVSQNAAGAQPAEVVCTPARLHDSRRFAAARTGGGRVLLREWGSGAESLGYTLAWEDA